MGNLLKKAIIKWLGIESNNNAVTYNDSSSEMNEKYLFDFRKGWSNNESIPIAISSVDGDIEETKSKKIIIKPIDVLDELEKIPNPIHLNNLDDKILILRDKQGLITQKYAKREVDAMIERLNNRKQYLKYRDFFNEFPYTNEESIKKLLDKYSLVMETSDIFVPDFPDDAIEIMKKYTANVEEISGKKPIFYVIAEKELFDYSYGKRDPILLAQCPFSFNYQILGAWDKEMLILSEL